MEVSFLLAGASRVVCKVVRNLFPKHKQFQIFWAKKPVFLLSLHFACWHTQLTELSKYESKQKPRGDESAFYSFIFFCGSFILKFTQPTGRKMQKCSYFLMWLLFQQEADGSSPFEKGICLKPPTKQLRISCTNIFGCYAQLPRCHLQIWLHAFKSPLHLLFRILNTISQYATLHSASTNPWGVGKGHSLV